MLRKMVLSVALLASVGVASAFSAGETKQVEIKNATEFTLLGLEFPEATNISIPELKESVDAEASATIAVPTVPSRIKMDMGMVRFVFPAGNYSAAPAMELGMDMAGVPYVDMQEGENIVTVTGALVNLRASDAGDEARYDFSQFFYPADINDAVDVLAVEASEIQAGYKAPMFFWETEADGIVRADDKGALSLELTIPLTAEGAENLFASLRTAGMALTKGATKNTGADTQWQAGSGTLEDADFCEVLAKLVPGGKGSATLEAVDINVTPETAAGQQYRVGTIEIDFAKKTMLARFK